MKVFTRGKGADPTPIDVEKLEVSGMKLGDILSKMTALQQAFDQQAEILKNAIIIEKDKECIVKIGNDLHDVKRLEVYEKKDFELPIKFYKVENHKIVIDNKKVGVL